MGDIFLLYMVVGILELRTVLEFRLRALAPASHSSVGENE